MPHLHISTYYISTYIQILNPPQKSKSSHSLRDSKWVNSFRSPDLGRKCVEDVGRYFETAHVIGSRDDRGCNNGCVSFKKNCQQTIFKTYPLRWIVKETLPGGQDLLWQGRVLKTLYNTLGVNFSVDSRLECYHWLSTGNRYLKNVDVGNRGWLVDVCWGPVLWQKVGQLTEKSCKGWPSGASPLCGTQSE